MPELAPCQAGSWAVSGRDQDPAPAEVPSVVRTGVHSPEAVSTIECERGVIRTVREESTIS